MRERKSERESTAFQEGGAYESRIDIKTDVAIVYGINDTLPERVASWRDAGYRVHVMVGIAWGNYQDYIRGEWDGQRHDDDAQAAVGNFRLEHGISQGGDICYMVPTEAYTRYLLERLKAAIDVGAAAIHLEEPEFWVRGGYSPAFQREWFDYYGEPWQDPVLSVQARYRTSQLQQYLYTRALRTLCHGLKVYATSKGVTDFRCYVPTHSLLNYTHWRIVSPGSQLMTIPECDGLIAQVWTGTARTRNVYMGMLKERTFETAYCEYAACAALVRGTDKRLWLLADPIEDDPNHAWEDYRRNWQATVTASLLVPEVSRYEVVPWPKRVFKKTYPKSEQLRHASLQQVLHAYTTRLTAQGQMSLAAATEEAVAQFEQFCHAQRGKPVETLGFAAVPIDGELRFSNILTYLFDFYHYLYTTRSPQEAARLRDAIAAFYDNPTEQREGIPPHYETELQIVFNALADMDWDVVSWQTPNPGIGLVVSDTLQFQRGEPAPSDEHLSPVYGLALPLVTHGLPLTLVQMERITLDGYLNGQRILMMSYDGMKPTEKALHHALVEWVRRGGVLIFFGDGDAYNQVEAWWNTDPYSFVGPHQHLFEQLGVQAEGVTRCGAGWVISVPQSPTKLAYASDGVQQVRRLIQQACQLVNVHWQAGSWLGVRRGPYVVAAGLSGSAAETPVLHGHFINLFDATLPVLTDPMLPPDTCWLLYDLTFEDPQKFWVIAASGRVSEETCHNDSLSFRLSGVQDTNAVARVRLPGAPRNVTVRVGQHPILFHHRWDTASHTLFLQFPAQPTGVHVGITYSS